MKKRIIDIVFLSAVTLIFIAVSAANLFQTNRPIYSEKENRTLAQFPAFSVKTLLDGSYFEDVSSFISDTFLCRDELIGIASNVKTLYGIDDGGVIFIDGGSDSEETQSDETLFIPDISDRTEAETEGESIIADTEEIIIHHETQPEENETEADTSDISDETETDTETEPDPYSLVEKLTLSKKEIYLEVGGESEKISGYVEPLGLGVSISWRNSDNSVAKISADGKYIVIEPVKAGECVLTAKCGDLTEECKIVVTVKITPDIDDDGNTIVAEEPEFLTSGFTIYQNAVYAIPYYVDKASTSFAQTVDYYAALFSKSRISVVCGPLSSCTLELDTFGNGRLQDQNDIINKVYAKFTKDINGINPFDKIWEHRDEYLYFKTDHHWTQRGAYYAYAAFAESIGLTPTPIEDFEEIKVSDSYIGSMYKYTNDERVKTFPDSIYLYMPTKENTMTIYKSGSEKTYDSCIIKYGSYGAYLLGDNPYTIIKVPENDQSMTCLVLKDSYGNAFVPFLCEHYGTIIVVDPRYVGFDIYEKLKDYPLTDVIFCNNIYNCNSNGWCRYLLNAVGISS